MNGPLLYLIFTIQMHGLGVHVRCIYASKFAYVFNGTMLKAH